LNKYEISLITINVNDTHSTNVEEFINNIAIKEYLKKKIIIIDNVKYFKVGENIC